MTFFRWRALFSAVLRARAARLWGWDLNIAMFHCSMCPCAQLNERALTRNDLYGRMIELFFSLSLSDEALIAPKQFLMNAFHGVDDERPGLRESEARMDRSRAEVFLF